MKECWLSPYGEVIYTSGMWGHAEAAAKILFERYNDGSWEGTQDVWREVIMEYNSPTDLLQEKGWIKFSTITNEWIIFKEPTTDQKNKMFDLTGYICD